MKDTIMEHIGIKIPKELIDQIDQIIQKYPEFGYTSRAEFIKECIRTKIKDEFIKKKV
jgi:metal-responsive CopG/Arc/MetJ family transcriptional regulator